MDAAGEVVSGAHDLLAKAQAEPRSVIESTAQLSDTAATADTCIALRARSIAFRVLGNNGEALTSLDRARSIAEQLASDELLGTCLFSSAPLLALDGRIEDAREALDAAAALSPEPIHQAEVAFQRGGIALLVAEWRQSHDHYSQALPTFRDNDMAHHVADALLGRGLMSAYLGDRAGFEQDLTEAADLFAAHGDEIGIFQTQWNQALGLALTGDPAAAIAQFTEAEPGLAQAGFPVELYMGDQAEALFALGLHEEAIAQAEFCVEAYGDDVPADDGSVNVLDAASRRLELARIHSLCGSDLDAFAHAERAHAAFVAHGQRRRAMFSETVMWQCRLRADGSSAEMAQRLAAIDVELGSEQHPEWRSLPLLVAAEAALHEGNAARVDALLDQAQTHEQNDVLRLAGLELGVASARRQGQAARALALVSAGFGVVENRSQLDGSAWVRAVVTRKVEALVDEGLAVLAADGDAAGAVALLARSQARLDGAAPASTAPTLIATPPALRCWFEAGGDLFLVSTDAAGNHDGIRSLGDAATIAALGDELGYLVRRAFRDPTERRMRAIETAAAALEEALAVQPSGDATLQLHLPSGLTQVPVGLFPSLRRHPWVRIDRLAGATAPPPLPTRIALVAGPDLEHAADEVRRVADFYGDRATLVGGSRESLIAALDSADLVHIAAHSELDAVDVMQSAIRLRDGDLALAELEQLARTPPVVILASCESAGGERVGVTQLGISDALLAAGVSVVVGTALAIPDCVETLSLMEQLHRAVRDQGVIGAMTRLPPATDTPLERLIGGCFVTHLRAPLAR